MIKFEVLETVNPKEFEKMLELRALKYKHSSLLILAIWYAEGMHYCLIRYREEGK